VTRNLAESDIGNIKTAKKGKKKGKSNKGKEPRSLVKNEDEALTPSSLTALKVHMGGKKEGNTSAKVIDSTTQPLKRKENGAIRGGVGTVNKETKAATSDNLLSSSPPPPPAPPYEKNLTNESSNQGTNPHLNGGINREPNLNGKQVYLDGWSNENEGGQTNGLGSTLGSSKKMKRHEPEKKEEVSSSKKTPLNVNDRKTNTNTK
jgi:hypothetical protein